MRCFDTHFNRWDSTRAAAILAVLLGTPSVLFAAEEEPAAPVYGLDTVVVTATRTHLAEKKVPMSTTVVSSDDMRKTGVYNVRDALKTVPGLNVLEAGMTGNMVSIRGMGTASTLILVDGRRMAGEDSGSTMNVYELNRINVDEVDRIEVIRGAGAAVYGSDAMGGVINIITKKDKPAGGYIGTRTGSREKSVYGGLSTGRVGKLDMNVNYNLTDVRESNSDGDSNMFGPKRYFDVNGTWHFTEDSGLAFGASFLKEQSREYTAGDPSASSAAARYDMTEWFDNNRSDCYLKYFGRDAKNDYEFQTYYNRLGKESRKRIPQAWQDFDHVKYGTLVVEGKNTYRPDTHHALTYGLEYRHQEVAGTRLADGAEKVRQERYLGMTKDYSSADLSSYAGYLQDEWQITPKLFFVPGIRWDHHSSFGAEFSPRAGLTYELSRNARVKTNYGYGYRAPSVFELYSHMDRNMGRMQVQVWGNKDLQAEESRNFDIGVEAERGKAAGKLTYFHNKIDNLINARFVGRFGRAVRYLYYNIDKASMDGVEAEFSYRFGKHWDLNANYTYLDARDKATDEQLEGHARNTATAALTWTDAGKAPWTATLYTTLYDRFKNGEDQYYTWSTTNFVLGKDINRQLHVYAGVDNLFNKTFGEDDDYSIYGRTWRAGLEYRF